MIEVTQNDDGTFNIKQVKQSHCICGCKLWDDGTCGCGIPEHHANAIGNHHVQFGDLEHTKREMECQDDKTV
jgi:hypothetical protein